MANPNARLKYLFLLNSEDPVKAVIKFNEFLREVGVPEDEANIERNLIWFTPIFGATCRVTALRSSSLLTCRIRLLC